MQLCLDCPKSIRRTQLAVVNQAAAPSLDSIMMPSQNPRSLKSAQNNSSSNVSRNKWCGRMGRQLASHVSVCRIMSNRDPLFTSVVTDALNQRGSAKEAILAFWLHHQWQGIVCSAAIRHIRCHMPCSTTTAVFDEVCRAWHVETSPRHNFLLSSGCAGKSQGSKRCACFTHVQTWHYSCRASHRSEHAQRSRPRYKHIIAVLHHQITNGLVT
jgi:hypothetical protein